MKKLLISLCIITFATTTFAQSSKAQLWGMPLKRLGTSMGIEFDMIQGFSANSFGRMAGISDIAERYEVDGNSIYSGFCENPHVRLQAAWQTNLPKVELITSALIVINRFDGLTFYGEGLNRYDNYLTFNTWGSEIGADVALIRRFDAGPFGLQLGVGGNTGYSFANAFDVTGNFVTESSFSNFESTGIFRNLSEDYVDNIVDTYELSDGISQRAYAQMGLTFTLFRRVELGLEGRWGYGYRWHFEGEPIATNLRSIGATARWVLK